MDYYGGFRHAYVMIPGDIDTTILRRKEKKEFAKHFGPYLRKIRESKNISQENLSMNAGYYRTYVNKIETGGYSPSLHTVWRLANELGMTLKDFFKDF